MKLRYLIAGVAVIAASPVAAQDATSAFGGMSGPRIEARVGYDNFDFRTTDEDDLSSDGSIDGVSYGGEIGFDLAVGGGLIGAYAGADLSSGKECSELFGLDELCLKVRRNFTAGVRGGFLADERVLLYVKGGYSNAKFRATYEDFEDIIDDFSESDSRGGYHVGGGVEGMITDNIYAKLEYVYSKYKTVRSDFDGVETRDRASRDQFVLGLGFRF